MKKLEDRIIGKVYEYEEKNTRQEVIKDIVLSVLLGTVTFIFGFILIQTLREQQTFDVLSIFSQDASIIKEHFQDILAVLSYEIPKDLVLYFVASLLFFSALILIFLKNSGKIKRRFRSIKKYRADKK